MCTWPYGVFSFINDLPYFLRDFSVTLFVDDLIVNVVLSLPFLN